MKMSAWKQTLDLYFKVYFIMVFSTEKKEFANLQYEEKNLKIHINKNLNNGFWFTLWMNCIQPKLPYIFN